LILNFTGTANGNQKGKNLLYTVKKCNLVADGNGSGTHICHTIRETFKGAMNYAYGSRAELDIRNYGHMETIVVRC